MEEVQYLHPENEYQIYIDLLNRSTFIQWGRTYVLDTTDGIIVKRIFDNGEYIVCRSNNPEFPEFPVHKKEIYHMALVVGLVRQF